MAENYNPQPQLNNEEIPKGLEFENKPLFDYPTIDNSQKILNDLKTNVDTRPLFIDLIKSNRKLVGDYKSLNPEEITKYKERIHFLSDFIGSDEASRDSGFHVGSAFNIVNSLTKGLMDPLKSGETDFKSDFEFLSESIVDFLKKTDINDLGFPATVALKRLLDSHAFNLFQNVGDYENDDTSSIRNKINEINLNVNKFSIFNTKDPLKAEDRAIEFINSFATSSPMMGKQYKTGKLIDTFDDKLMELKMTLSFSGIDKRNNYSMQILEEALGFSGISKLKPEDFSKICLTYNELFDEYYENVKVRGHNGSSTAIIPSEHLDILNSRAQNFLRKINNIIKINPSVAQNIFATDSLYQVLKKVDLIDEKTKEIKVDFEPDGINNDFFKDKEHYFATDVSANLGRLFIDNFKSTRPMDQRFSFDTLATQGNSSVDKFWDYMKFVDYSTSHARNFPPLVIRSCVNIVNTLFTKHFDYLTETNPENSIYSKDSQHIQMIERILKNINGSFYSKNPNEKIEDPSNLIVEKLSEIENIVNTKTPESSALRQMLKPSEI